METDKRLYTLNEFRVEMYSNLQVRTADIAILMCAILIASVGLNMNSTPVIIGAMLISPLMGPILGVGVGLAVFDLILLRRAAILLAVQVAVSIIVSTVYFMITPISYASSEILARTSPNIWDVIIALAGGTAGIIGARKKTANNIVPGVAIATALMPPICTVGYSLATHNFKYFLGSFYLFVINCGFIGIATFIGVRVMMLKHESYEKSKASKKVKTGLILLSLAIIIPSLFSAASLVQEYIKKDSISRMITQEFSEQAILSKKYDSTNNILYLTVAGKRLTSNQIDRINEAAKDKYGLSKMVIKINQVADYNTSNQKDLYKYIDKYIEGYMNSHLNPNRDIENNTDEDNNTDSDNNIDNNTENDNNINNSTGD